MRGIFLIIILALSTCSSKPYVVKQAETTTIRSGKKIYVVSHGWHTGFVVPAMEIQSLLPRLKERFGDTPYIEFGWGDDGFYQAKEITTSLTLRAMFWPTESVVHATAVPDGVYGYFSNSQVEEICLGDSELFSLVSFIADSFRKDEKGKILELKSGIYGDSQFYRGADDYHLTNTCNKWTAKGLKKAGFDISPAFKLTARSVMTYIQNAGSSLGDCI